jgi:hypothetical protein
VSGRGLLVPSEQTPPVFLVERGHIRLQTNGDWIMIYVSEAYIAYISLRDAGIGNFNMVGLNHLGDHERQEILDTLHCDEVLALVTNWRLGG